VTTTDQRTPPSSGGSTSSRWVRLAQAMAPALTARAEEHDKTGVFPTEAFSSIRASGLSSMLVPHEYGGPGATHDEACDALSELGKADATVAVTLSMHYHLVATQVWHHKQGHDTPLLRRVHDEQLILVSTGASDWTDSYGSARRVDGGFRISARKAPSSGTPTGDIAVTSVPWPESPDGPQVIHCAVPLSADGISVDETWNSMGIRASGSHTIVFDDVFVADDQVSLVRPRGPWHPIWNTILGAALPLIMSGYLGAATRATEIAIEAAKSKPEQPHIAPSVGQMLNSLATAQDAIAAMVTASNDLTFDATDQHAAQVLTRKTITVEALMDAVRQAVAIIGGRGYSRGNELERIFRDIHGAQFHPLPGPKQTDLTGRIALGLDPLRNATTTSPPTPPQ